MVAQERIKCADIEEELKQVRGEKEALKQALRLVEEENEKLLKKEEAEKTPNTTILNSTSTTTISATDTSDPLPSESKLSESLNEKLLSGKSTDKRPNDLPSWTPPEQMPLPKSPLADLSVEDPWR